MEPLKEIIKAIELHSVNGIRNCFEAGLDPETIYNNEPLIYELTSEYTRSAAFKDCVKLFVDYGMKMEDKALLAVLLNDAGSLAALIKETPALLNKKYTMRCAYTPLYQCSLLHICAEFNHVACASVLVQQGVSVNTAAGIDENGFGGHTPIFHTVNQNNNQSADMMQFLLDHMADLSITVKGLVWGKGYSWETFIPAVNPFSYTMMGLLPQMHRTEKTIAETVSLLMKHHYGLNYIPNNIPNAYLR